MFTGLVEGLATVISVNEKGMGRLFTIKLPESVNDIKAGDSLCVDGVCLTCERVNNNVVEVFAMAETLNRSTLANTKSNRKVNFEQALRVGDRLGGHWVTGHVDCIGNIASEHRLGDSLERWIKIEDPHIAGQIAEKGSITIDGTSLTVARKESWGFSVVYIPYTFNNTNASLKNTGMTVNIETDILAKYLESLSAGKEKGLTLETLKAMGY